MSGLRPVDFDFVGTNEELVSDLHKVAFARRICDATNEEAAELERGRHTMAGGRFAISIR